MSAIDGTIEGSKLSPGELRKLIRDNKFVQDTSGSAPGFLQANLVVLPSSLASDFMLFCIRNPKPCPIIDVTEVGSPEFRLAAPGADVRTDVGKYKIFKDGQLVDTPLDILSYWRDDFVGFLLGCSYTFENALRAAGITLKHEQIGQCVSIFKTNIQCTPSKYFKGPLVVSMRPIPHDKVVKAVQASGRYPAVHGAPVHIGDPAAIGIRDITKPDWGSTVPVEENEVPVFWACGLTPHAVAAEVKPEIQINQFEGYMFLTDLREEDYAVV